MSQSGNDKKPDLRPCLLCCRADDDRYIFGEKHSSVYDGRDVVVHYLCCLFSCQLVRAFDDDEDGIRGFAEKDIVNEVRRGKKLRCCFCRKTGATLGCCVGPKCKKSYHLPCAQENGVQLVVRDSFQSFCRTHRKFRAVVISDQIEDGDVCASCKEPVDQSDADFPDVIQCRCCQHVCHKKCVQTFAYISGKYHFKCSFCNCNDLMVADLTEAQLKKSKKCKSRYIKAAEERGVFIPEKDADWELDSSFDANDREYGKCDITDKDGKSECICERGTEYDEPKHKRNKWYIALCSVCAAHGCHRFCRGIAAKDCETWTCDTCSDILSKSKENRRDPQPTSAARNSNNRSSSPPASGSTRNIANETRPAKRTEKINGASRERLNPLTRISSDNPDCPQSVRAPVSPVTPVPRSSSKRTTSDRIEFSIPKHTSTPKVPKTEKIDVITLSDDSD